MKGLGQQNAISQSAKSRLYVRCVTVSTRTILDVKWYWYSVGKSIFFLGRYTLQCLEMRSHDLYAIVSNGLAREEKPHTRGYTHTHTCVRARPWRLVTHMWLGLGLSAGQSRWSVRRCSLCSSELFVWFDIHESKLGKIKYDKAKKKETNSEGTGIVVQTVCSWTPMLP